MDIEKYYLINIIETAFDESNKVWTADLCNLCGEYIVSFDVSDIEDFYWQTAFKERQASGANDTDEFIESFTVAHLEDEHEAECTLISMDSDNKDLIRSFIGDKVDDNVAV